MSSEANSKRTLATVYAGLSDGTISEHWFTWAEWMLVSGALYGVGKASTSALLVGLGYFSALLTGIYGLGQLERISWMIVPSVRKLPTWGRWVVALFFLPLFVWVTLVMGKAIETVLTIGAK